MPRNSRSSETPSSETILEQVQAAVSGRRPAAIRDMLQTLAALRMPLDGLLEQPPRSRRLPRRTDVVTYRVRADLTGTKPPLWRRLELASDLSLDQVHEIMQVAFGWADSHLHQFGSGPGRYDPATEHYLCPYQVEEGDPGVPEEQARLEDSNDAQPGVHPCGELGVILAGHGQHRAQDRGQGPAEGGELRGTIWAATDALWRHAGYTPYGAEARRGEELLQRPGRRSAPPRRAARSAARR